MLKMLNFTPSCARDEQMTRQVVLFWYLWLMQLATSKTEQSLAGTRGFDTWPNTKILTELLAGQRRALDAVERALPAISIAADLITSRLTDGGKLIYAGAGTSIRIAVQDGSELPATFGMAEEKIDYLIAGGRAAMFETLADAEDDGEAGRLAAAQSCTSADALIAVAASGHTPYTIAAARQARSVGCCVIAVVNNAGSPLAAAADHEVLIESGPEVISGSTRMGAGTAQKATLNLLSTLVHTRLGAVHDGFMVNVQAGNQKLVARAARIVSALSGQPMDRAESAIRTTGGHVKPAVLLLSGATDLATAQSILSASGGNLRLALSKLPGKV